MAKCAACGERGRGTSRFDSKHKLCPMHTDLEVCVGMLPRFARQLKWNWTKYKRHMLEDLEVFGARMREEAERRK